MTSNTKAPASMARPVGCAIISFIITGSRINMNTAKNGGMELTVQALMRFCAVKLLIRRSIRKRSRIMLANFVRNSAETSADLALDQQSGVK